MAETVGGGRMRNHESFGQKACDPGEACGGEHTYHCAFCGALFETSKATHVVRKNWTHVSAWFPFDGKTCAFEMAVSDMSMRRIAHSLIMREQENQDKIEKEAEQNA